MPQKQKLEYKFSWENVARTQVRYLFVAGLRVKSATGKSGLRKIRGSAKVPVRTAYLVEWGLEFPGREIERPKLEVRLGDGKWKVIKSSTKSVKHVWADFKDQVQKAD